MLSNPGKPVTIYDVAQIVGKAYPKAFTCQNITKGFQVSGIWPLDENIFGDDEFLSSYVTDRPLDTEPLSEPGILLTPTVNASPLASPSHAYEIEPSTSKSAVALSNKMPFEQSSKVVISPVQIRPFPKAAPRKLAKSGGRRLGKSRILTDTPEKEEILANQAAKKTSKTLAKKVKKKLVNHNSSSSENENEPPAVGIARHPKSRAAKQKAQDFLAKDANDPNDDHDDFDAESDWSISELLTAARKKY